ncbi:enoyl-CoA hydratase/isomerase family protein [Terrihabitans rhizophilus]|uniref:Enoyl-CoA hydratase/isomerase family protein n=1 Tax=Terrihabitans rhizophilus TaxID=3092662 RepID=A0ABU4RLC5_9HYPH|nr:enoyl-CoA hydratase/isomerase family protein [Terrihabitans sp. PJ23]MDX6804894.1 enoyl-CoA hydratase/isomerase family protein [Terrihabitans sp. PJ23]
MSGQVHYTVADGVGSVVFDRPEARNAMTWGMYDALAEICGRIAADRSLRVVTFRGAGGEAFVAGTDIEQFREFKTGGDGLAYEEIIDARIGALESLPVPTIAVVEGFAIGGGLAIAAACDFRIATPATRFGIPIARTLGNTLSIANTARVLAHFGPGRAKRMLMLAELLTAQEARDCGFLTEVAEPQDLEARLAILVSKLSANAPVTMRVQKESMNRIVHAGLPHGDDLVAECYGSRDFKIGVEAFLTKQKPVWTGE